MELNRNGTAPPMSMPISSLGEETVSSPATEVYTLRGRAFSSPPPPNRSR